MRITMLVAQGRPKGKCLRFSVGEFVFGRGDECHVRPNSPWVSRQHCLLRITAHAAFLRDLGSTNGSLVNGRLIMNETELQLGDHIQVGPLVLKLIDVDFEGITIGRSDKRVGESSRLNRKRREADPISSTS